MKEPSGKLVELDFYFNDQLPADALRDVVEQCLVNGGKFSGEILASQFKGARTATFQSIYCEETKVLDVTTNELWELLADPHTRVVKVPIESAVGLSKSVPEIVTFCGISKAASLVDTNPVAIVGEGWVFGTPGYHSQAQVVGRRCYKRFVELCSTLTPDYAAILAEEWIPCRSDLRQGIGHDCFLDFFLRADADNSELISRLERMYADAYTERTHSGIYVSTTPEFNPKRRGVDGKAARERSKKVAEMLKQR